MSQAFKMYEMVNKYLNNSEDAKAIVLGIEGIIDQRFESQKDRLATKEDLRQLQIANKEDISQVKEDIHLVKMDLRQLETKVENGFNNQLKWIIGLMLGISGLIVSLIKLL